jgi:8-oxo-dGTP pyrophosphatase MutT (NUDIX family)
MNERLNEEVAFSGKIGEVIHTTQPDGRVFERYRRSPGIRLVIVTPKKKIIMSREHRQETGGVDLRLPGGKVCDTLGEYHALLASGTDLVVAATLAAAKEGSEEVGVTVNNLSLLAKANAGATVEWDLFYFMTHDYQENAEGQNLEHGEQIERVELSPPEIREAIINGEMQEWRSVGVLLGLVLPQLESE